jgi:excisionase family DNA binding protein
LPPKHERYQ